MREEGIGRGRGRKREKGITKTENTIFNVRRGEQRGEGDEKREGREGEEEELEYHFPVKQEEGEEERRVIACGRLREMRRMLEKKEEG